MLLSIREKFGDKHATLKQLRKGWVFLMEQEKRDLAKMVQLKKAQKSLAQIEEVDGPKEWWEEETLIRPITERTL